MRWQQFEQFKIKGLKPVFSIFLCYDKQSTLKKCSVENRPSRSFIKNRVEISQNLTKHNLLLLIVLSS